MPQACPFCRHSVQPTKNAAGQLVCPRCNNTGKPVGPAAAPIWSPTVPPPPAPGSPAATWTAAPPIGRLETPGKATAALILGIVSFVLPVGLITAPLAWIFGNQAMRMIEAQPHSYTGHGMARAGKILGIVWVFLIFGVAVTVVLAALVFVLVSNFAAGNNTTADPVVMAILG